VADAAPAERLFGRQPRALRQAAAPDVVGEPRYHLFGEIARRVELDGQLGGHGLVRLGPMLELVRLSNFLSNTGKKPCA
jgi:hypothetical protein